MVVVCLAILDPTDPMDEEVRTYIIVAQTELGGKETLAIYDTGHPI